MISIFDNASIIGSIAALSNRREGKQIAEQQINQPSCLTARPARPLIAIIRWQDGEEFVDYFISEEAADAALERMDEERTQRILSLFGVWSDLDWDTAVEELDRIRHESKPSPPLSFEEDNNDVKI